MMRVFILALLAGFPVYGSAAVTMQTLDEFTGGDAQAKVTLADDGEAGVNTGEIKVTVEVVDAITGNTGDLRGVWLDIDPMVADEDGFLNDLSVTSLSGGPVTDSEFGPAGTVNNLGGGNNLNGGGTPAPFDMGFEIGNPGLMGGSDDFQMTMFTLSHQSTNLTLAMFAGQDIGVRLTSVGPISGDRSDSSKLGTPGGDGAVPLPASFIVWSFVCGVVGLGYRRR